MEVHAEDPCASASPRTCLALGQSVILGSKRGPSMRGDNGVEKVSTSKPLQISLETTAFGLMARDAHGSHGSYSWKYNT